MKRRQRGIIKLLMRPINPASIGLQAFFSILAGVWLMMPWNIYEFGRSFRILAEFSQDWMPGLILLLVGLVMLRATWTNRAKPIILSGWVGYAVWWILSVLLMLANPFSVVWILAGVPAMHCAFIAMNVNLNKGIMPLEME